MAAVAAVRVGNDGAIAPSKALRSRPRIAVLLPVPVVPSNLKCLVSSARGTLTPASCRCAIAALLRGVTQSCAPFG